METKEVEFRGIKATVKQLTVRDKFSRTAIYQKLDARLTDMADAAFEYAQICAHIVEIEGINDWEPTMQDTPEAEANKQFEAWLSLPIEIGDWLLVATHNNLYDPKKAS